MKLSVSQFIRAISLVILLQFGVESIYGSPLGGSVFGDESGFTDDVEMANAVPRLGRRSPRPFRFIPEGQLSGYQNSGGGLMGNDLYSAGFRFRKNDGALSGNYLNKRDGTNEMSTTKNSNGKGGKSVQSYLRRLPEILTGKFDSSKATLNVVQDYYWTKLLDDVAKNAFNAKLAKLKSMAKEVEEDSPEDSVFSQPQPQSGSNKSTKFSKPWSSLEK
uniref:Uncharacterized protein n=1 Tax=Lepeophtheirus salmonis TaxID=72036 RepID=A0A0K2TS94_LEPSM